MVSGIVTDEWNLPPEQFAAKTPARMRLAADYAALRTACARVTECIG
jgi:hypothetical protein